MRGNLVTVRRIVYEALSVSPLAYGHLDTANQRYKSEHIDDAIAFADLRVVNILLKAKQDMLLTDLYQTQSGVASGTTINQNWALIKVVDSTTGERSIEIEWDTYDLVKDGGVFDITNYKGYHTFRDGKIYTIMTGTCAITYIDLTHPVAISGLNSPSGFENVVANFAISHLLMKRMDRPDEAGFYEEQAYKFLAEYGIPQSPQQEKSS